MKTVVLGASPNPARYAWLAVTRLHDAGHEAVPVGIKKGIINGIEIINDKRHIPGVHTVTLYLNPDHQKEWYDYILSLNPVRIVFNPGTENAELETLARERGIQTIEACTVVLLSIGEYDKHTELKKSDNYL